MSGDKTGKGKDMGELRLGAPVAGLASRTKITPEDVAMLRGEVFRDGVVTRGEAEALFALDTSCEDKCREWSSFFVEALTDFVVHQEVPSGYVSQDNADWLIRSISIDGKVETATELDLLIKVLETARSAPDRLAAFALNQVAIAVIDGEGPLVPHGATLTRGAVSQKDVALLRRILYAQGGGGNLGISRAEAEVLFDLNDKTAQADNHADWDHLFVGAIANHLMCVSGYMPPTREDALRVREWLDGDPQVNVGGFLGRMVSGGLSAVLEAYRRPDGIEAWHADKNARVEAANATAEAIDQTEAKWLVERIGRDGQLHRNEAALLSFLREESPDIHPDLKPLLDRVA